MTTLPAARVWTTLIILMSSQADALQQTAPACVEWRACRELAVAAETAHEYEAFHDLAWRAVQTGPARDAALLYLLARAQARSGRPHDALVMLDRIADTGAAAEAITDEAFIRTRELPGWPAIEERLKRLVTPSAPSSGRPVPPKPPSGAGASTSPTVSALPGPPASGGLPAVPAAITEAGRFLVPPFSISGLAYDSVSDRFVLADRAGRKLVVAGNASTGGGNTVDLVRADSAGFKDISALELDTQRGDLWVVSGEPNTAGMLHRVQLVSGRPLRTYPAPSGSGDLVDLAVMRDGEVLVLDAAAGALLHLRTGGTALEPLLRIDGPRLTSVAAGDEGVAYVSQGEALFRVDVRARKPTALELPRGLSLKHLERIRLYRGSLLALVRDEGGSAAIVRLELNAKGTAVTRATRLDVAVPSSAGSFSIAGNDLLFAAQMGSDPGLTPGGGELIVYRVRLRN